MSAATVVDQVCLWTALLLPIPLIIWLRWVGVALGAFIFWVVLAAAGIFMRRLDPYYDPGPANTLWLMGGWIGGIMYCLPIFAICEFVAWRRHRRRANPAVFALGIVTGIILVALVTKIAVESATLARRPLDVSDDPHYRGGYGWGNDFKLQQDMFVVATDSGELWACPPESEFDEPGSSMHKAPSTDEYRQDPKKWPTIKGVLLHDYPFRPTQFVLVRVAGKDELHVSGEWDSGAFKGTVRIDKISRRMDQGKALLLEPDPRWLVR